MPQLFDDVGEIVEETLQRVGKKVVLALPLGIGKPNLIANEFFRRVRADATLDLTIFTALSLRKPTGTNDLERRFLEPLAARVFGNYPPLDYLEFAKEHGLRRAIVSSASRNWIDMHLERLEQAIGWDAIITADRDAGRAKPSPTMYLEALERLDVGADEAVVFEDSPNGVRAGKAAGLFVVGIPNEVTRAYGLDEADLVVDSLADLPPAEPLQRADGRPSSYSARTAAVASAPQSTTSQ